MANTTNYGWETPDDTDYVYQGAAAARTTANSIDTTLFQQISNSGYGNVSNIRVTNDIYITSTAEQTFFSGEGFTPVAGRLYEVTYTVGNIQKLTNDGVVYVRLRKFSGGVSGTLFDIAIYQQVAANEGFPFSKTILLTSTELGTTNLVLDVTLAASNNGVFGDNTAGSYGYGIILVKDIGPV
jgi:hypothetical protein